MSLPSVCDTASSRWSAECAAAFPSVCAAVAIHPNETATAAATAAERDAVLAEIARLAALPQVRAVGETGLDYYRDNAPPEVQREWFRAHIEIAKQAGKPLMIHDRDAHEDVLVDPGRGGRTRAGDLPLLLRRRDHGRAVRGGGLRAELRRDGDVRQRCRAARGGRGRRRPS